MRLHEQVLEAQSQHMGRLEALVGSLLNLLFPVGTALLPHPSVHVAEPEDSLEFAFGEDGEEHK